MHKKFEPRVSVIALFGALGIAVAGPALALPLADCTLPLGPQASEVPSSVTDIGGGQNLYDFRVCNRSDSRINERPAELIRDWELPFFGDAIGNDLSEISNIDAPEGWNFSIEEIGTQNVSTGWSGEAAWQQDGDPFKEFFDDFFGGEDNNPYNDVTHVLHFYTGFCEGGFEGGLNCFTSGWEVRPEEFLDGFSFESPFGNTNAPYQASWINQPVRTGDPDFPIGASPTNPIIQQAIGAVPEPGSLALLGLGAGALAAARRRREKK